MRGSVRTVARGLHITASVGWMGAVMAFIPLAVVAVASVDPGAARAAFIGMYWIILAAIVPLAIGATVSGLVCAMGSPWGLTKHWWVLFKLALTSVCLVVLLIQVAPIGDLATLGADSEVVGLPEARRPLVHSVGGLVVLVLVQGLAVLKPRGLTPWAQ